MIIAQARDRREIMDLPEIIKHQRQFVPLFSGRKEYMCHTQYMVMGCLFSFFALFLSTPLFEILPFLSGVVYTSK